jgi:nucleoside-diphosphate-sugar epimerase
VRAVIFGGAGFIGTHLAKALIEQGDDVTVADIAAAERPVAGVRYERVDVRERILLERSAPFDAVYNFAAVHRTPGHEPFEYYETNVRGALNVTQWCEDGGEKYIGFTSSIAVYGPTEDPKSETSPLAPNSEYGRSKLIAEEIHDKWLRGSEGRKLITLRPAVVFGLGEHGNFTRLANALEKKRFMYAGRTDVIKSCGYVGELVQALQFAEGLGEREVLFNFCYKDRYDIQQICEAFHDVAGYDLPRMMPKRLLNAAMKILKTVNPSHKGSISAARVAKLTASTNIVPANLESFGYEWKTDIRSALSDWMGESEGQSFQ